MASIAIVIGGAALNATSFIGGNYVVRYLSGDDKHKQKKKEKDMIMLLKNITRPLSGFERGKKNHKILSPKMTGSNIRPLRIS